MDNSIIYLLNLGLNPNLQDIHGNTALHYAVKYGHNRIIKKLLQNGADKNILNKNKISPAILARENPELSDIFAIKGICQKYKSRGNHIITTNLEHSSIKNTLNYLKNEGFCIDYVKLDKEGKIDLEDLKKLLTNDTILITISAVDSELGIKQPIKEIDSSESTFPPAGKVCFGIVECLFSGG